MEIYLENSQMYEVNNTHPNIQKCQGKTGEQQYSEVGAPRLLARDINKEHKRALSSESLQKST